ncbi:MAG: nuclear transport factor 2 family protein [Pseudomonadales bacterium]|jgi:ketosteroid isomerase-like protein
MLNQEKVDVIMTNFRRAYGAADVAGLRAILTDDFQWHMHHGASGEYSPTGQVLAGVDAMLEQLLWRREHWTDIAYGNLIERPAGDLILQTFTTKGVDESGVGFHVNVVDLYCVREDKIYRKDTYWKQA